MNNIERNPNKVLIFDTTLRDGFQAPGVNVGPKDRLEIAKLLAKMRVDVIEAGFPISSKENFESVRTIAKAINDPIICGLSRANPNDVDRCWEAIEPAGEKGGARIHTFIATSDLHMQYKLRMTPEQVIVAARQAVRRAKEYTSDVEFSPEDATRSNFNFMMRVVLEAVDAGATTINIPDTVGYAQPVEYAKLIKAVKRRIDEHVGEGLVVVSAHCHNDLGLAVANTLAAVMAGARQVEVSVNGIGERAGSAALEEVVASFRYRPDFFKVGKIPLSIQTDPSFIFEISELVERVSGVAVQPNKSVVGESAFSHEAGIHAAGVKANKQVYEIMRPEDFGNRQTTIVIGAESGHSSIAGRATELGFMIEDHTGLTERVKEYANIIRRAVTDVELERLVADFTGEELKNRFILGQVEIHGSDHGSGSTVNILIDGESYNIEAEGEGPIDAAVSAINQATGLNVDIVKFTGSSLGAGSNAKAGVNLTVQNEIQVTAYAEDNSVPFAAIKAYVAALNTISRTMKRMKQIL